MGHFFYTFSPLFPTHCRRTRSCSPRRLKTPSPPRFIFLGRQTTSPVLSGNQINKFWKSINSCWKILENIFVNIWYSQISRSNQNLVIMSNLGKSLNILTQTLKVNLQESYWRAGQQRLNKARKRSSRNAMLTFVNNLVQSVDFSILSTTFSVCWHSWNGQFSCVWTHREFSVDKSSLIVSTVYF